MQSILSDLPNFEDVLSDYDTIDCTIGNSDTFYFLIRGEEPELEDDESFTDRDVPYRIVCYQRTKPRDEQFFIVKDNILGFSFPHIEMTYTPLEKVFFYDGSMNAFSSTDNGEITIEDTPTIKGALGTSCIGNKIYFAKARREVKYRTDTGVWHILGEQSNIGLPEDISMDIRLITGFEALDGFNESHIYAVGGDGDVWRCIDNEWMQCSFPVNMRLASICCAGDGKVYVSGREGITYVGIEDNWTRVAGDTVSLSFDDIVWHEDKLWCSNDYGLWWVKDGVLELADVPPAVRGCSRTLSARFGKLLVAGFGGAALHENGEWTLLY